jgi:amino acid transporter
MPVVSSNPVVGALSGLALVWILVGINLLALKLSRGLVAACEFMILIVTLALIIPYAFSVIASLILRLRDPVDRPARSWSAAAVAVVAFGVCFWVVAVSGMETV